MSDDKDLCDIFYVHFCHREGHDGKDESFLVSEDDKFFSLHEVRRKHVYQFVAWVGVEHVGVYLSFLVYRIDDFHLILIEKIEFVFLEFK